MVDRLCLVNICDWKSSEDLVLWSMFFLLWISLRVVEIQIVVRYSVSSRVIWRCVDGVFMGCEVYCDLQRVMGIFVGVWDLGVFIVEVNFDGQMDDFVVDG